MEGWNRFFLVPLPFPELDFTSTGLVDAFPDLPDGDLPSNLICMHMTPDGDEWWLGGQDGHIMKVRCCGLGYVVMRNS